VGAGRCDSARPPDDAWLKVRRNGGAAGADGVTIEQFEERLKDRLYKLWNRMSSGSYFPGPVRARWGLEGAEAILKLRALRSNKDFHAYWQYHLAQERRRVHESRYANSIIPQAA
jgi:hypothetical protein